LGAFHFRTSHDGYLQFRRLILEVKPQKEGSTVVGVSYSVEVVTPSFPGVLRLNQSMSWFSVTKEIFLKDVVFQRFFIRRSMFNPPKADKCLLASGEFDVHLSKQQVAF